MRAVQVLVDDEAGLAPSAVYFGRLYLRCSVVADDLGHLVVVARHVGLVGVAVNRRDRLGHAGPSQCDHAFLVVLFLRVQDTTVLRYGQVVKSAALI